VNPGDSFAADTVESARRTLAHRFREQAIDSPDLDARMLLGAVLDLDLTGMISAAKRILTSDESARLEAVALRRLNGEPVARILGVKEFWGLPLRLSATTGC
jgi:release factor glutamine methyltransferase